MTEDLSVRAYARRIGRSPKAVRKHIDRGVIRKTASGRIDPAQADAALQAQGVEVGTGSPESGDPSGKDSALYEDPALANLAARLASGEVLTKAQAEQLKENYLARLRMLEVERKEARLVDVETVAAEVAGEYGRIRNRLLNLPSHAAPRIFSASTAAEAADLLAREVHAVLGELTDPEALAEAKAAETARKGAE